MPKITLREEKPGVDEFIALRPRVGWGTVSADVARKSIDHALFTVCLRKDGVLMGLGRVVGDGVPAMVCCISTSQTSSPCPNSAVATAA